MGHPSSVNTIRYRRLPLVDPAEPITSRDFIPPSELQKVAKKPISERIAEWISIIAAFSVGLVAGFSSYLVFHLSIPAAFFIGLGGFIAEGAVFWEHVKEAVASLIKNPFKDKTIFSRQVKRGNQAVLEPYQGRALYLRRALLIFFILLGIGTVIGFTAIGIEAFTSVFGATWIAYGLAGLTGVIGGMAQGLLIYAELLEYLQENIVSELKSDFKPKHAWKILSVTSKAKHTLYSVTLALCLVAVMVVSVLMALGMATAWANAGVLIYHSVTFSQAIMWGAVIPGAILFATRHSLETAKMFIRFFGVLLYALVHPQKTGRLLKKFFKTAQKHPRSFLGLVATAFIAIAGLCSHIFGEGSVSARGAQQTGTIAHSVFGRISRWCGGKMSPAQLAMTSKSLSEGFTDMPFAIKRSRDVVDTCCDTSLFFNIRRRQLSAAIIAKPSSVNPLAVCRSVRFSTLPIS